MLKDIIEQIVKDYEENKISSSKENDIVYDELKKLNKKFDNAKNNPNNNFNDLNIINHIKPKNTDIICVRLYHKNELLDKKRYMRISDAKTAINSKIYRLLSDKNYEEILKGYFNIIYEDCTVINYGWLDYAIEIAKKELKHVSNSSYFQSDIPKWQEIIDDLSKY